jgi:hypothetical protein
MAKRKIKNFLKKVAPLALAGFGAAMLGKKRRQAREMKDFLATEGGDISNITSRPNMMDIAGPLMRPRRGMNLNRFTRGPAMNPSGDIFGMDATGELEFAMPAKGGRIVKTKRGGKAVRKFGKKKKQANKMRKK